MSASSRLLLLCCLLLSGTSTLGQEDEGAEEELTPDNEEIVADNDEAEPEAEGLDGIVIEGADGGNITANDTAAAVEFVEVDYSLVSDVDADEEVLSKANITSVAHKLITLLFDKTGYNTFARPVRYIMNVTQVEMTVDIINLLEVDGVASTIKIVAEMTYTWIDELLQWNPDDFYGVDSIVVPTSKVWRPDVACIQTIEVNTPVPPENDLCRVAADGRVHIQYLEVHELSCPMASKNFPYDVQLCRLDYGSYAYYTNELIMSNVSHANLRPEANHPEWRLAAFNVENEVETGVSRNVFKLLLVRKSSFYVITLMLPSSLVTFLSILGVFTPGDISLARSEKINLAMITLLALSVLLTVMSDILPKTDKDYPLIGRFFYWQIGTIMVHVAIAVGIMFLNTMPEFGIRLPGWAQRINVCVRPESKKEIDAASERVSSLVAQGQQQGRSAEEMVLAEVVTDVKEMVEEWHNNKLADAEDQANRDQWEIFCFMLDWICLVLFMLLQTVLTIVYCQL